MLAEVSDIEHQSESLWLTFSSVFGSSEVHAFAEAELDTNVCRHGTADRAGTGQSTVDGVISNATFGNIFSNRRFDDRSNEGGILVHAESVRATTVDITLATAAHTTSSVGWCGRGIQHVVG